MPKAVTGKRLETEQLPCRNCLNRERLLTLPEIFLHLFREHIHGGDGGHFT